MNSISNTKNCYGCGVCVIACPHKIIKLDLNKNGFYQPEIIEPDKCTDCGSCLSVCAYTCSGLSLEKAGEADGYAAWSNNEQVRRKCSSGGIGFETGKKLIESGYKACGVRYNLETNRAEHFIAATVEEYLPSIGSKYIPSYTVDAFSQFDKKEKYFVVGTPCQMDSLRRYFRLKKMEDNVVLMDFLCHGVPSMLMWKKYLKHVEKTTGKIIHISWRNKLKGVGWHASTTMVVKGEKNDISSTWFHDGRGGDLFFSFFLSNMCLNKPCLEKCKYKFLSSSADLRVGDFWGGTYGNNEDGISALIAFTSKGRMVVRELNNCTLKEHPAEVVAEAVNKHPEKPWFWELLNTLLRTNLPLDNIYTITKVFRIRQILEFKLKHIKK
jgi:NAD-dependent dihydropyrimidine dehydrogenase PreA subunit